MKSIRLKDENNTVVIVPDHEAAKYKDEDEHGKYLLAKLNIKKTNSEKTFLSENINPFISLFNDGCIDSEKIEIIKSHENPQY